MKPEDLKKAQSLVAEFNSINEQLSELEGDTKRLEIGFFKRKVYIDSGSPQYDRMKHHLKVFLELRRDNIIREGNQIGLSLISVIQ